MTDLTPETTAEVRTTVDELAGASLPAATWRQVDDHLRQLRTALDAGDEHATRAALVPLGRAAFEAKVQARLGPKRPSASVVVPTKRTPALPAVGAVCGAILLFLGWQLGGGLVLAATAALALLVLGVAVAGMHANADRAAARQTRITEPDPRVRAPAGTLAALSAIRDRPTER